GEGSIRFSDCPLARCRAQVLRGEELRGNEGSRNLLLECDGEKLLLCGDAEEEGLFNIFTQLGSDLHLAALLIPHHGSEQVNLDRLISHTSPAEVWFSASRYSPLAQYWPYSEIPTRWTARDGGWSVKFKPSLDTAGNLGTRVP
ncbi:MAG: hypothetical protein KDB61_10605, partial [Planctomycetes bacterium]|nr:hypothetical protein [Planctomycetota bacterium]